MSFRCALAAIALCVGVPMGADAQERRHVELGYEITFAGFSGFRIDVVIDFDGSSYDIRSHAFKEGTLKALTLRYEGRNRAWGHLVPGGAHPAGGSLAIAVQGKTRTWLAQYGPGGTVQEEGKSDWTVRPGKEIPEDKRNGSFDPLSGGMFVAAAGDQACNRVVPTNDGHRRIDVVLQQIRTDTPAAAGLPQLKDDLLVCTVYTKRIAGEFWDSPEEAESEKERPMTLWFAKLEGTPLRYPVKLEAKGGFGTIRGKVLHLRNEAAPR